MEIMGVEIAKNIAKRHQLTDTSVRLVGDTQTALQDNGRAWWLGINAGGPGKVVVLFGGHFADDGVLAPPVANTDRIPETDHETILAAAGDLLARLGAGNPPAKTL
jgi:hypothetical protein